MQHEKIRSYSLTTSRKGNVGAEIAIVLVVLIVFAFLAVINNKTLTDLNTDLQNDTSLTNESKAMLQTYTDEQPSIFDNAFTFIFAMLWIGVVIASFLPRVHPIFLVTGVILMTAMAAASMILSNAFQEFADDSDISSSAANFPKMMFFIEHLLQFIIAIAMSIVLALYAKNRLNGDTGSYG